MLLEAISAGKDLGRAHEIASILVRCGFGGVVQRFYRKDVRNAKSFNCFRYRFLCVLCVFAASLHLYG